VLHRLSFITRVTFMHCRYNLLENDVSHISLNAVYDSIKFVAVLRSECESVTLLVI